VTKILPRSMMRWLFVTALAGLLSLTAQAQIDMPLRELADEAGIYVGAAAYTYHLDDPLHADTLRREFNLLTPENEAKWCEVQPRQGRFDFRKFDRLVAFAEQNEMAVHGHTLLWHQCVPSWLAAGDYSRDEAIQVLRDHIMTVVGRYKGRIAMWDVVNEGVADNGVGLRDTVWQRWIGDDYMELAFQFAHEADPDALLFYNDYGAEGLNAKSDAIYVLAADFVERGVPIHGIGLQSHLTVGDTAAGAWLRPSRLDENIQRFGELGLQVQITEIDVRYAGDTTDAILQQQADDYQRMLETCLDNDHCTAFIIWGVSDQFTWLRETDFFHNPTVDPLLFDENYAPKPAYFAVQDVLARYVLPLPLTPSP
jgi:GH35 family endo-1,4-beta-xylanase